ncbi:CPBP family intramembrane metalloprotease [Candidatus Woesebacteria bacterium]|nr:CPBP family intramembrane metalloprotease [Candidatus Woesebacteria bacterium]
MPKKEIAIKHATIISVYLLVVWGFYRFLFKLPEEIEELLIKPVLWLGPVFYFLKREKKGLNSIGVTSKNLFPAIYYALFLGVIFAIEGVLVNVVKHQTVNFSANIGDKVMLIALGLSLATAISEEITFRGFIFNRVWHALDNPLSANLITSIVWALVHVPIAVFWWKLDVAGMAGYLVLTTVFAIGSSFVFTRTKNVTSSILLHVLWEWPIILFR